MNYKKVYTDIIEQAISNGRVKSKLYENHHIVPRCMGGLDDNDNLVLLTPREHFICHHLLCKIYDEDKLKYAFWMMYTMKDGNNRGYRITSSKYEILRKQYMLIKKPEGFQVGENNSQFGTFWVTNGTLNLKLNVGENIPIGYYKGRHITPYEDSICNSCGTSFKPNTTEKSCSELCKLEYNGGLLIVHYQKIYDSYLEHGSVRKSFDYNGILYSGRRCKSFHQIRKLYGDNDYKE